MTIISGNIIILGAGPTGLMLANQLTRFGIDHVILDQKSGPTDQSRALVVHARSMEIYQQLGLSDQVVADAQKNNGLDLYKNGKRSASITLVNEDETASPFPFLTMYEQSKNETLLYNNLLANKREVQWNTVITEIKKAPDGYFLHGKQNGMIEDYHCKYLVACDGSKSIARDFAAMDFSGGTYQNVFYVADTHVDADFSSDKLSLFLTDRGITMLFPMKGINHFRALGILPKEYYHREEISFEEILDKAKAEIKMPVTFYDTNWHSTYRLHHKKVARFNKDDLFFAGDAAHVHSPAGGQGMNTGLQDAYNLAWKLALVEQGKAAHELLATYHEERDPVARELLKTTDRLFSTMSSDSFWQSIFRLYLVPFFVPLITRSKLMRKKIFLLVSQLTIAYKGSSLSKGKAGKIKAGTRLPYFHVSQNKKAVSIYELVRNGNGDFFTLLIYGHSGDTFGGYDPKLIRCIQIDKHAQNDKVCKETGFPEKFVMLVRPDNYIGYISITADRRELDGFLQSAYYI